MASGAIGGGGGGIIGWLGMLKGVVVAAWFMACMSCDDDDGGITSKGYPSELAWKAMTEEALPALGGVVPEGVVAAAVEPMCSAAAPPYISGMRGASCGLSVIDLDETSNQAIQKKSAIGYRYGWDPTLFGETASHRTYGKGHGGAGGGGGGPPQDAGRNPTMLVSYSSCGGLRTRSRGSACARPSRLVQGRRRRVRPRTAHNRRACLTATTGPRPPVLAGVAGLESCLA
jgi:hypothetical protein